MGNEVSTEKVVQEIRRKTHRRFSAEEKIRIVPEGLRGEESIATLCRRDGPEQRSVENSSRRSRRRTNAMSPCRSGRRSWAVRRGVGVVGADNGDSVTLSPC